MATLDKIQCEKVLKDNKLMHLTKFHKNNVDSIKIIKIKEHVLMYRFKVPHNVRKSVITPE